MVLLPPISLSTTNSTGNTLKKYSFFILSIIIALGIGYFLGSRMNTISPLTSDATQSPAIQTQVSVNKTFSFPVFNSQGQKVTDIGYTITTVDKQNQIIIKGERANAVSGRTFLIINIKLVNTSNQAIQLNTRDYIRVSLGSDKDLLAADIHNDPVVVQAISTVYTRLGFPVDSTQKHITLHVGELNSQKTDIPVTFTQ